MGIKKSRINQFILNRGNFTMIPNEIWEMEGLDWLAKVIWCYLFSRPAEWDSSRNNVAKNLGMSVNTVSAYIKTLEKLNMVKVHFGARNCWDFEIVSPDDWIKSDSVTNCHQITERSSTESPTDPDLNHQEIHTKEEIILKKILPVKKPKSGKPKKEEQPLVKEDPIPEELMDYYLILKTVSLHLKFRKFLPKIKEVWPEYESFQSFLAQRKAFYEQSNVITENFHKFKAVISKAIKGELGV